MCWKSCWWNKWCHALVVTGVAIHIIHRHIRVLTCKIRIIIWSIVIWFEIVWIVHTSWLIICKGMYNMLQINAADRNLMTRLLLIKIYLIKILLQNFIIKENIINET